MEWTSVYTELPEEGNWEDHAGALNALAIEMHPKKSKNGVWGRLAAISAIKLRLPSDAYRIGTPYFGYEVLIPNLSERNKLILQDLGYTTQYSAMSKKTRRSNYEKITKNK